MLWKFKGTDESGVMLLILTLASGPSEAVTRVGKMLSPTFIALANSTSEVGPLPARLATLIDRLIEPVVPLLCQTGSVVNCELIWRAILNSCWPDAPPRTVTLQVSLKMLWASTKVGYSSV